MPSKRGVQFNAHFQVDLVIPIHGDVPAGAGNVLSADDIPDHAARVGHDRG